MVAGRTYDILLSLQIALMILANSDDSNEMQGYAALCLGLHCLPENRFRGFQYTKVQSFG